MLHSLWVHRISKAFPKLGVCAGAMLMPPLTWQQPYHLVLQWPTQNPPEPKIQKERLLLGRPGPKQLVFLRPEALWSSEKLFPNQPLPSPPPPCSPMRSLLSETEILSPGFKTKLAVPSLDSYCQSGFRHSENLTIPRERYLAYGTST